MTEEIETCGASRFTGRKVKPVLVGATRVFLERGFAATSMDDVAAAAGVSKRTLYQYFESKEALFVAVVRRRVEDLIQTVEADVSVSEGGATSLMTLAQRITQRVLDPETINLYRIVIAEAARLPELGRIIDRTAVKAVIDEIEQVLVRVAAQRGVRLESPAFAADVFISVLYGLSQVRALLGVDLIHEPSAAGSLESRIACFERAFGLSATKLPPKARP